MVEAHVLFPLNVCDATPEVLYGYANPFWHVALLDEANGSYLGNCKVLPRRVVRLLFGR